MNKYPEMTNLNTAIEPLDVRSKRFNSLIRFYSLPTGMIDDILWITLQRNEIFIMVRILFVSRLLDVCVSENEN